VGTGEGRDWEDSCGDVRTGQALTHASAAGSGNSDEARLAPFMDLRGGDAVLVGTVPSEVYASARCSGAPERLTGARPPCSKSPSRRRGDPEAPVELQDLRFHE
jgi:hypothetical protein